MNPCTPRRRRILSASIVSLLAVSATAVAQQTWDGQTDTNWNTALNWSGDVVPSGVNAIVNTNTGNIATISQDFTATPVDILVGTGAGATGQLNHTAGTASTGGGNWMFVGVSGGTGTYNLANTAATGGTLTGFGLGTGSMIVGNVGTAGRLYVGGRDNGGGGTGTVNVNTSGTLTIRNDLAVGSSGGTGVVNVDAGTITTGGWNFFGKNEPADTGVGGSGTLKMSGGTLTNTGRTYVGQTSNTGKIELTGSGKYLNVNNELFIVGEGTGSMGQIVVNGANAELRSEGELWIGQAAGGKGSMTVSAGTVSVGNWFAVGREGATGVLTINGTGLVQKTDTDGSLEITNAGSTTASGTVNLDGGTLRVNNITGSGGAGSVANLFLNGGTLKPTVANTDFINGVVVPIIKNGGAIIDTDGFDITITKTLAPDTGSTGGLTKKGNGTLTLAASSSYTGPTVISGGALLLDIGSSISTTSGISVNGTNAKLVQNSVTSVAPLVTVTNGTLDGTGTFDRVTVTDGGTLTNGVSSTGVLTIGTLTFNGAGALNLQTTTGAPVSLATTSLVTGATNSAGLVNINVSNTNNLWSTGTYSLISYTTLGGQGFADLRKGTIVGLGARQAAALTNSAGIIGLTITGDLPVWTGATNGNWTTNVIGGASNWKLQTAGTPTDFITGDTVLFNDSATGTTNVNISTANVSPTSTTFDNSTKNYTISSAGGFGIATGLLTKSGTGAVTLATTNTYAGGTTLNGGTLNLNNSSAIGTGTFTINSGTIDNTSASAITLVTNNPIRLAGDLTFTGTRALNLGTGAVTLVAGAPTQAITITNNSTLTGTPLTFGGAVTGTGSAAFTLNIAGTGNTAFTGNITTGTSSLVINDGLSGTLTLSGPASSITTLNINGAASSIVELGAGNLTVSNGGGNIVQSTTGGTINATGGGSLVIGSALGDFGTASGTTLTVNAKVSGANAVDFYSPNGNLGTIVLAAANDFTGAMNVEDTHVVVPTGGAINAPNTDNVGQVTVGTFNGSIAVLDITGGTINATKTAAPSVVVGNVTGSTGAINLTTGTINSASEMWVGSATGGYGSFVMSGGTVNVGNWFAVGRNGNGIINVNGGTLNVTLNNFTIGSFTGAFGVANLNGGTVNITNTGANQGGFLVGEGGTGNLNVSGTAALNIFGARGLNLVAGTGMGVANLNGGTVTTPLVQQGAGTGILNFSGGIIKASAASTTFMQGLTAAYVNSGGAIIDDGGFAITIAQPLLAPSGNGVSAITFFPSGGYIGAPLVQITGDGTGATGVANIDATGNLTGITVTNPGVGYTNATATLIGGGGGASADTVTLKPNVSGGFTKKGTGTVTLSGANTYTGPTVIEAGTLALTGSISASTSIAAKANAIFDVTGVPGGFSLTSGQTLTGNGTVTGNVIMSAGAKLAPGDVAGTLTFNGLLDVILAVTPANSGALQFELGGVANSDKVAFATGALTIGTGVLGIDDFAFTTLTGIGSRTYTLFDGNTAINGTLDSAHLTGSLGAGFTGTLSFADNGRDIVLTVVPEAGSATLLLAGTSALLGLRRFRRRSA